MARIPRLLPARQNDQVLAGIEIPSGVKTTGWNSAMVSIPVAVWRGSRVI